LGIGRIIIDRRKLASLDINLFQCHVVHHKSHILFNLGFHMEELMTTTSVVAQPKL
jgi:hypothetical protein